MRNVYEIRERPSRMYSWTALVTSQVLIELPWNILGATLLFLTWFWTVGFESSRGGYTYLMLGIAFPLYYTTIAQVGCRSPRNTHTTNLITHRPSQQWHQVRKSQPCYSRSCSPLSLPCEYIYAEQTIRQSTNVVI